MTQFQSIAAHIARQTTSAFRTVRASTSLFMLSCSACIIPDHDIQFLSDCGVEWCVTIPMTGDGRAWGDQVGTDVAVMDVVNGNVTALKRCVCMTPAESRILDAGCTTPPCDPEFVELQAAVVNLTYEACITASAENYEPDLNQHTATVNPGNTCLEASEFWTPTKSEDACSVPSEECDTDAPLLTGGGGSEPFITYSIPCSGGTCTVPDGVIDEIDANPEILMSSTTRLTQVKSGGVPIGMRFSGISLSSLAYRLGFRNNDIVQEINGLPFKVQSDLFSAFVELRVSETATLKVRRGTSTLYLNFTRAQPWP